MTKPINSISLELPDDVNGDNLSVIDVALGLPEDQYDQWVRSTRKATAAVKREDDIDYLECAYNTLAHLKPEGADYDIVCELTPLLRLKVDNKNKKLTVDLMSLNFINARRRVSFVPTIDSANDVHKLSEQDNELINRLILRNIEVRPYDWIERKRALEATN